MGRMHAKVLVDTKDLTREDWLEWRRKVIGGSDIGAICGVNPYRSPMSVYLDKIGELPPLEENDAMHFGNLLEPVVADEYARRTGYIVEQSFKMYQHPEYPFAGANVDRFIINKERGNGVLEIKTASEFANDEWSNERPPLTYQLQLMWYLWITGLQWGAFAALVGGNKFYMMEMERDDEVIAYMIERAKEFWSRVESRTPPQFDGSADSENVLKFLYPHEKPNSEIALSSDANYLLEQYEEAAKEEKAWAERKAEAANRLKALLGENEKGVIGERVVTWRTVSIARFDSKAFRQDNSEMYEQYLRPNVSRRFSVK